MDRIAKLLRNTRNTRPAQVGERIFPTESVNYRQAYRSDLLALEWEGEFAHFRRLYAEAYRYVELGQAVIWVVDMDEAGIIGQLFVHLKSDRKELADGRSSAYVYGFRVRPAFQSKGFGTRLLQVAENDLIQRGFKIVNLNVGQDNDRARIFYERMNYQVIGTDPGRWSYYDQHGKRQDVSEPAWRMQKEL